MRPLITALLMTLTVLGAKAGEADRVRLVVTLAPGVESVGDRVDYVDSIEVQRHVEVVAVDADEADAAMALLHQRDDVDQVERDQATRNPDPQTGLVRVMASATFTDDPLFNDASFEDQYYWATANDDDHAGASTIQDAVEIAELMEKKSIAVVDGGFHDMESFPWAGGYSFVSSNDDSKLGAGPEFTNSHLSDCSEAHGQWVGSVIGGAQDDNQGNAGVVDVDTDADIYAARVLTCDGSGRLSDAAEGIRWAAGDDSLVNPDTGETIPAIERKAELINVSLGGKAECPSYLQDAIDYARSQGAIIVVSAGNTGDETEMTPGNCNGVITTGATDQTGAPASFSTRGDNLDYSAAGVSVQAFDEVGSKPVDGTSFSAPLVIGMMANLWKDIPGLSPSEIKQFSFESLNTPPDFSTEVGEGILDARKLQETAADKVESADYEVAHPLGDNCADSRMLSYFEADNPEFCGRREITVNTDIGDRYLVVFETDGELSRTDDSTSVHQASQASRFLVDDWDKSMDYGVQVCDNADGTGCDSDALIALDLDDVELTCDS